MQKQNEQNLIQQAKKGHMEAVAQLYQRYWRAARATAYGITANLSIAEDSASEAFYAAMEGLDDLKDTTRFGAWLRTIVVRTAQRYKIKQMKHKKLDPQALPASASQGPDTTTEQLELVGLIHQAVANLSEIQREAVSLFYFEGYSIEDAAHFLTVPIGTFKRRLHDGRRCLRSATEYILDGTKPTDLRREHILQQLQKLIDEGPEVGDYREVLRKAIQLRPLPYELMAKYMQRHSKVSKHLTTEQGRETIKRLSEKVVQIINCPSARATNENHPVGKVISDIRGLLPEFKFWQMDPTTAAQNLVGIMSGNISRSNLPPGFSKGIPGMYMYIMRGCLIQVPDGSYHTSIELFMDADVRDKGKTQKFKQLATDTLILSWLQSERIELRDIENLLRQLAGKVVPDITVCFTAYEEPRYRSALRMQLGDVEIPAAIGGPIIPGPTIPETANAATVQIFLEAWATAQSGQVIELENLELLLEELKKTRKPTDSIDT